MSPRSVNDWSDMFVATPAPDTPPSRSEWNCASYTAPSSSSMCMSL